MNTATPAGEPPVGNTSRGVTNGPVRIGVLGAARIAPGALIRPAASNPEIEVVAVAARDRERAQRFAARHQLAKAYGYQELLADPEIDAVYVALPNGLHGRWTRAALEAGKHVLCEKPFTANGDEAALVAKVVGQSTDLVVMQAFHYRYHALTQRILDILRSEELGAITRLDAWLCFPLVEGDNIRWSYELAGGALMDAGCYPIHLLRTLAGAEPEVITASAKTRLPNVDRYLHAELSFGGGVTGAITASMLSGRVLGAGARLRGTRGTMRILNPFFPQFGHRLLIKSADRSAVEHVARQPSTYAQQLRAFANAVLRGQPPATDVDDAVATMRVIDACYRAAGLPLREPTG
jgi:predicted dehydrogenase